MNYPGNQMEFEAMFKTEQDCINYLVSIRWPHDFECPVCGSIRYWAKNKGRFECGDCHTETTVTNGTIFHKSTKPLLVWFRAIWWMVAQKNGVSAKGLQKILGFGSYQTAWTWLHKFRRLMVLSGRSKLQGTVEVDEVFVGGKKPGKRGLSATFRLSVAETKSYPACLSDQVIPARPLSFGLAGGPFVVCNGILQLTKCNVIVYVF